MLLLLLIQCNRLTTIDLIQTLDFLFNLILQIFIQLNPSYFIQSYWHEVVNLFYWGEFYVNTCVAYEISKIDDGGKKCHRTSKVSCIIDNNGKMEINISNLENGY